MSTYQQFKKKPKDLQNNSCRSKASAKFKGIVLEKAFWEKCNLALGRGKIRPLQNIIVITNRISNNLCFRITSVCFLTFFVPLGKKKVHSQKFSFTVTFLCVWIFFHTCCSSEPVGLLLSILQCSSKVGGITVFHISHILQRVLTLQFQGFQVLCLAMDLTPGKVWMCQGLLVLHKVCSGALSWRCRV